MKIVLKRFVMQNCKQCDTPITKRDKFSLNKCHKDKLKKKENTENPLCYNSWPFNVSFII